MQVSAFKKDFPGRLVPTIQNAVAFVPDPIPTEIIWNAEIARVLADAEHAVGKLAGAAKRLVNPFLIGTPLLRREAIVSSRMEGTVTSATQLAIFELGRSADEDSQEVVNYMRAMRHGLTLLRDGMPLCNRMISEIHRVLLEGVRGGRDRPGEFRTVQNWIGREIDPIRDARFIPPPPNEMLHCMYDLEEYLNEEWSDGLPLLIRLALVHYQFEAIHPFRDGNGRVGRLLIPLMMCNEQRIGDPLFYMSDFFEKQRESYEDLMLRISQSGEWNTWIRFFLVGVAHSANEAVKRADGLFALRSKYQKRFQEARSSALLQKLVDRLFLVPSITISAAAEHLGVTAASASSNIRKLVRAGILEEITGGTWRQLFVAREIMEFMEASDTPDVTKDD